MLRALADPDRLRLIQCLRDGPRNVTELAGLVGGEVVNVSHHLGVLRHAGVVLDEKQGTMRRLPFAPGHLSSQGRRSDGGTFGFGLLSA